MASIRATLTTAYAVALIATMAAFTIALFLTRRASIYRELETQVSAELRQAIGIIGEAVASGDPVTVEPETLPDSARIAATGDTVRGARGTPIGPVMAPRLRTLLEGVPEYILVLDPSGRALYVSFAVRRLSDEDRDSLSTAALEIPTDGAVHRVNLRGDRLIVAAQRVPGPRTSEVRTVVAGISTRAAIVAPRELVGAIFVVAPLVLLLSIGAASMIAGRAFQPVQRMINEVEAITDGRSLHRRLPAEAGDELSRLAATLNEMIARLETSFGALRRFTADASHELKTPLTVLRADVERAMSPNAPAAEKAIALEEALQETARMADLVDSLLTLARADEGRFDLFRTRVNLEPLAREVLETAVILGEDAGLTVSMPIVEDAVVLGDRTRLRQLFMNLVTNAIKYTSRGGSVELALSHRLDSVTFSVRDTGIGIAAADLPYVFERFWRADRVRSRASERGGFGLGLSIAQYIAQAHGGSLTVTSRLGRGSTFTVSLPFGPSEDNDPGESGAERAEAAST